MAAAPPEDLQTEARPPDAIHVAPPSGGGGRRSMAERPLVRPVLMPRPAPFSAPLPGRTYDVRHRYVRRYWTAVVGPTAVADLLRMVQVAKAGRRLRLPFGLSNLLAEDLVRRMSERRIGVPATIMELGPAQLRRLPPALRAELAGGRVPDTPPAGG